MGLELTLPRSAVTAPPTASRAGAPQLGFILKEMESNSNGRVLGRNVIGCTDRAVIRPPHPPPFLIATQGHPEPTRPSLCTPPPAPGNPCPLSVSLDLTVWTVHVDGPTRHMWPFGSAASTEHGVSKPPHPPCRGRCQGSSPFHGRDARPFALPSSVDGCLVASTFWRR